MGEDNSGIIIIIIIAVFVGVILSLYFLSKILVTLGVVITIISIILLIVGLATESSELAIIGGFGLVGGLIILSVGATGVNFFEHNPTGQNLLGASNTIVNTTKQGVQGYVDLTNIH